MILYPSYPRTGIRLENAVIRFISAYITKKSPSENEAAKAIDMVENTALSEDKVLVVYLPECHESIAGIMESYPPDTSSTNSLPNPPRK